MDESEEETEKEMMLENLSFLFTFILSIFQCPSPEFLKIIMLADGVLDSVSYSSHLHYLLGKTAVYLSINEWSFAAAGGQKAIFWQSSFQEF